MPLKNLSQNTFQMVNINNKQSTVRIAIAKGTIQVGANAFELIRDRQLPKGDALVLAEIAGINGAKSAFQLIPLCHPLNLDHASIYTTLDSNTTSVNVYCCVHAYAKTGVEMEALAGVNAALLCIYDLTKMVEPALSLSDIRLLLKIGGKHGTWIHPDGIPQEINSLVTSLTSTSQQKFADVQVGVLKISDRASQGIYDDTESYQQQLQQKLTEMGMNVIRYQIIPNEPEQIRNQILSLIEKDSPQLIITTGGTGLSPRDTTPESITKICDRLIPGLSELLRLEGSKYNSFAWLSRSIVGMIKNTMIITLPGKPKAVLESMTILQDILPHALETSLLS